MRFTAEKIVNENREIRILCIVMNRFVSAWIVVVLIHVDQSRTEIVKVFEVAFGIVDKCYRIQLFNSLFLWILAKIGPIVASTDHSIDRKAMQTKIL